MARHGAISNLPGLQLRSGRRLALAALLSLLGILALFHLDDAFSVHLRDLGYITRPIWDKAPVPFTRVIQLDAALESSTSTLCGAHGLHDAPHSGRPQVIDAVIFSLELDLLEIRLHELYDVVDTFVIVEANVTFSGEPKKLVFAENRARFRFAEEKIVYGAVTDLHAYIPSDGTLKSGVPKREDPMDNEIRMRQGVSRLIDDIQPSEDAIILQSDVDELPSAAAIRLLKQCAGWGDAVHLGMPTYLYSFEFPMQRTVADNGVGQGHGPRQWRATAKRYSKEKTSYTHSRVSNTIIERAGWHCSFCFQYLEDFVFKMTSYSHNDRVTHTSQLSLSSIQSKICTGKDVYDMLPEAYDFSSLIKQIGPIPKSAETAGLPTYLLKNPERMSYLLPGGCRRERQAAS